MKKMAREIRRLRIHRQKAIGIKATVKKLNPRLEGLF
jgi:hypothetical protein